MAKNSTSKQGGAKKPGAQRALRLARSRVAKKRIRRVIFKADEWYEGAAMSIGIAGRAKTARPMQFFMARAQDKAD